MRRCAGDREQEAASWLAPSPWQSRRRLPSPRRKKAACRGETFRDCGDCTELVIVPNGEFTMGSNDKPSEAPPHRVLIHKAFAIGRRLITFSEWDRCVAAGGCKYAPPDQGQGGGDLPATNLSWDDAQEFVAWMSKTTGKVYRLPNEAEWEFAARAGSTTPYWWGKDIGKGRAQCSDCGTPVTGKTTPVGSFRPNVFGLYDTAGDAAEWVSDCWNPNYKGAPADLVFDKRRLLASSAAGRDLLPTRPWRYVRRRASDTTKTFGIMRTASASCAS